MQRSEKVFEVNLGNLRGPDIYDAYSETPFLTVWSGQLVSNYYSWVVVVKAEAVNWGIIQAGRNVRLNTSLVPKRCLLVMGYRLVLKFVGQVLF